MNATTKTGPAYIADATPGSCIRFNDPRDQSVEIVGMINEINAGVNGRSVTRTFTMHGMSRVFTTSCNYHITII